MSHVVHLSFARKSLGRAAVAGAGVRLRWPPASPSGGGGPAVNAWRRRCRWRCWCPRVRARRAMSYLARSLRERRPARDRRSERHRRSTCGSTTAGQPAQAGHRPRRRGGRRRQDHPRPGLRARGQCRRRRGGRARRQRADLSPTTPPSRAATSSCSGPTFQNTAEPAGELCGAPGQAPDHGRS